METMMAQQMAQGPFYYYAPDATVVDSRQHGFPHGHFQQMPHPHQHPHQQHHSLPLHPMMPQHMPMYPMVPTLPSTPIYSRPNSSSSCPPPQQQQQQQPSHASKAYTSVPMTGTMTPAASPSPRPMVHAKPAIILETELNDADYFPSTPPLSTSGGSVVGSPGSCDMLQTPLNPMFSGLDGTHETKDLVDFDVLPKVEWSSCASPPMTPVYIQSQKVSRASPSIASELLSTASCPSLSPSPTPYAHSVSSDDVDFCDPRALVFGSVNSTLAPELPALPTLCAGDDDAANFVFRGDAAPIKTEAPAISPNPFEFNPHLSLVHGLPTFDDLSDLESEADFVHGLVQLNNGGRSRASSDAVSSSRYSCDDLEEFGVDAFGISMSNAESNTVDDDAHKSKRQKTSSPAATMDASVDAQQASTEQQTEQQQNSSMSHDSSNAESADGAKTGNTSDNSGEEGSGRPSMPNRRGRKQSLTEDPTKQFVCEICSRRFRRQEHLKRHYRSLHTQDKPFACQDCGKTFSRSDNLAQHARTHGSGAIVMDILDPNGHNPHAHLGMDLMGMQHSHAVYPADRMDIGRIGKTLFNIAAELPGSSSEYSSDEGGSDGKKKRKRGE